MYRMQSYSLVIEFALLAILVVLSLAACSDQGTTAPIDQETASSMTNPHVAALEQLPAYHMMYPGSVLLKQGALPPSQGVDGNSGANARKMYGIAAPLPTGVTGQAVLTWFHQQLQTQGWTLGPSYNASGYSLREYWTKANYYAVIGIWDNSLVTLYQPGVDVTKYPLLFDVSVGERGYQGM